MSKMGIEPGQFTHRRLKVRMYRAVSTPIGSKIRKPVDTSIAWFLAGFANAGSGCMGIDEDMVLREGAKVLTAESTPLRVVIVLPWT